LTSASLGGVISFASVTVTLSTTGGSVTGVSITAASASLNLGGGVTSTIGSVTGSYDIGTKAFSLTLNSVNIAFSSFVNISAASASLNYGGGNTTPVNLSGGGTQSVSLLTIGVTDANIFAGLNGPASNAGAVGVELTGANLALALMSTSSGTTYYGVSASATSLSSVGLPGDIKVGAGDLDIQINGASTGSTSVVNFDTSFTNPGGNGLAVAGTSIVLDFNQSLVQVAGTLNLDVTDYLQISGGFKFTQTASEVDITVGSGAFTGATDLTFAVGPTDNPLFSATGSVSMSFNATTFTLNNATLTVNTTLKVSSVLEVETLSVSLSNLSVDLATGNLSGTVDSGGVHDPVLTVTAASATLFPGSSYVTGSVTATSGGDGLGFQGTFDLQTGAFSIKLEQFHLAVGSVFTADSTDVLVTYNPADSDPHQQLVQIGSGTLDFKFGSSDITGALTNLTIYADGFHFDSVTIGYTGAISLGSILTLTNPSLTLTDFGVTFAGGTATVQAGSLTLSVATAALNVGSAFTASAESLSVTIALDPANLGDVTVTAGTLTLQIGSMVTITGTGISINTNPAAGDAYLSVGTATISLQAGSLLTLSGTAKNFSIINSGGTPALHEDADFGMSITATPGQLHLPTWLGFQIQKFEIKWDNFATHPEQFQLILSASINSIQGLPGGVTVSGEITDAVIDVGKLEQGLFPITSIGSVGGSVSGTLFGMEVNASFVMGVVKFNAENQIVNGDGTVVQLTTNSDGSVTETPVAGGDTVVVNSVMFVGVSGGAEIPGVGGVQIYIGFSSLGPLTFYLSAEFPLILDPDTGIAIGGFSGGVIFDYTIPTPGQATDLQSIVLSPAGITISQWEQQLRDQTVTQYTASSGGTNLTAAYSQPFVIEAGVTLYDAYLSQESFTITGSIAIQIDPAHPNSTKIFVTGTATLGGSVNFNAYLYLGITVSGVTSTATVMFLVEAPAATPIESFGGSLTLGFTDDQGVPLTTNPTATVTQVQETTATGATYTSTQYTAPTMGGFFISIHGFLKYQIPGDSAINVSINGAVTLTVTGTKAKLDLWGDLDVSFLGQIAVAQGEFVMDYTNPSTPEFYGALLVKSGSGLAALQSYGLTLSGALLFQINTTGGDVLVTLPNAPPTAEPPDTGNVAPLSGGNSTSFTIQGSVIFDLSILGVDPATSPYATVSYEVNGDTLFQMQGFFDLRLTDTGGVLGLQMFAEINSLTLGPEGSSFLSFSGFGLFVISSQGLAAEINLTLNGGNDIAGISFTANFNLVINTTSQAVKFDLPSVTVPTSTTGSTAVVGVTIYDSNNNPLPNQATSLIIPAGPPQGSLTETQIGGVWTGGYASSGAAGPYVVVTGSGTLKLETLTLNGYFYFQMSDSPATGFVLVLAMNVTGDISPLGTVTVTGAMQISSAGEVALLSISGSVGDTTDYGSGIQFVVNGELCVNTTDSPVTEIGGITLSAPIPKNSVKVVASGTLTLAVGGTGFVINGVFSTSTTHSDAGQPDDVSTTTIQVSGTLTAMVGGSTLLTMQVAGVLSASYTTSSGTASAAVYGALVLTANAGNPLSGNGFSFNGSFLLEVNTTGAQQNPTDASNNPLIFDGQTVVITAGPGNSTTAAAYVQLYAVGTLTFGTAANGFVLVADPAAVSPNDSSLGLYLSISTTGFTVTAGVKLSIVLGGTSLFSVSATAGLAISSSGLAATLTVTASFTDGSNYYLGGSFQLLVNTTGTDVPVGSVVVPGAPFASAAAGPYFELAVTGAKLMLGTNNPSATTALYLGGSFNLTISSSGLAISATTTLYLKVAGTNLFSFQANGALLISSTGIAAKISLTGGVSGTGYSFTATFVLEVNSTGSAINTINNVTVNLPAGPYFEILASGKLILGGVVKINGSFTLTMDSSGLVMTLNASINLFGNVFTVQGGAGIYSDGLALSLNLSLGGSGSPTVTLIPGVVTLSGTFNLQINTTGLDKTFGTVTVLSGTVFDVNVSASFNVFGFSLASTTFNIKQSGGVFSATGQVGFNFFGFITFTVDFYFDSNGNYWFYGYTYVQVGPNSFNIHGSLTLEFASNSEIGAVDKFSYQPGSTTQHVVIAHNFELDVSGGVTAFGISDIISADVNVTINGSSVDMSVWAGISIDLGLFTIHIGGTVHIHLGTLNLPSQPPPPPIAAVSTVTFTVDGTEFGPGTLLLYLGAYADSSRTNYPAEADENYQITQDSSGNIWVTAPGIYAQAIEFTGVSEIVVPNAGTSNTTIQIDSSVTVPVVIFAGSGTNQFYLGSGATTVYGSSGNDSVFGGAGNVTFYAGTGASLFIGGGTGSTHNTIYDPGTVTVSESGYSSYSLTGTSATNATLTYGGNTDVLIGGNISLQLLGAASGHQTFSVTNYSGTVTLDGAGNADIATSITLDTGNLTLAGNVVTESNGATGTITLQNINTLGLYGGAGANNFTVNSWSGSGAITLNGMGGSDNYIINFQSSGGFTANVSDSGAGGTDALVVNGTTGNDILNLTGSAVSLGSQTVNYSGIENLTVYTKTGNDRVNVTGTSASTVINAGSGNDVFNVSAISNPTAINLGSGTNTVNVGTLAPAESGGTLNGIQALLTVTGGPTGTNTLYLDDSADNSAATATLTATSLTGVFGAGGSLNYSGVANFNLYLGNGSHAVNVQGMNGTVNITLGSAANTINLGSNAGSIVTDPTSGNSANTGSILDQIVGTLNFTGTGGNVINVDDSGGNKALAGALSPTSLKFLNLVTVNLPNVVGISIALSQVGDLFAVADTFASASVSPVVVIDGNGGDDSFIITDTHAVTTFNGGDGGDSFYNFGNSSVLYLNGNAGDDNFYIYASVTASTSNVNAGAADSNGNKIYSYRVNAQVNIDGGSGNDKLYIFGTVLNDVFVIDGTHIIGAGVDVSFVNIEQLTIEGLGGDDTFYIEAITVPTTVVGDGSLITVPPSYLAALASLGVTLPNLDGGASPATSFNDTFYVGWQGVSYIPGSLAGIVAPLTIEGDNTPGLGGITTNTPGTTDTIYVDDSGDAAGRNFTLTATALTSNAMGADGLINYDGAVENLNLHTSTGNNTITVDGIGTAAQTSIYGGAGNDTFVVNVGDGGSLASPLALFGGLNTFAGDTLTINGAPAGNTFDLSAFTIDGAGATISYEQMEKLTINAGGATTFNVDGDSVLTFLNGGNAGDTFNVDSNIVALTIAGGTGNDILVINGNTGTLTVTEVSGANRFTVNGNGGTLALTGGTGSDTFVVNGNSATLTANGGAGDDAFTVNALSSPATLNGGAGNDSFTVNAPLTASLAVNGGGDAGDLLTINGTTGNDSFTVTGSTVSGVGALINYNVTNLAINGVGGNDTFFIDSTTTGTTWINCATHGNDTFNVQATIGPLYLSGSVVGGNVFNLGSLAPLTGGTLASLAGPVFIAGGSNTVNLDDSGDALGGTGTLTATMLTGFGMGAGITYSGVVALNIRLGSGNDIFNVRSTNATTVTALNTGAGANTVNVGSLMPAGGGMVDGVQGALLIIGGGNDTLNVDDTGSTAAVTGTMTATALTGLGLGAGGISFSGLAVLNLNLGAGNDTINVHGTNAATVTTLNTGLGTNTVNLGSVAPATGGVVAGIQGALISVGSGSDALNVDNTGSSVAWLGTLTATTLTGLGMGAGGVTYSGLATLNVNLGPGNDTFTVTGITNSTLTAIDGGLGGNNAILNFSGNFAPSRLTLVNFAAATLYVGGDFSGLLNDPGAITTATIGGSLTSSGRLNAGSIGAMTIGGDLAGLMTVTGLLDTLTVAGGTPGEIIAGDVHVITVLAGYGNKVFQVIEGGIERDILAAPVNGGGMPGTVHFAFVYDSQTAADPQLAIRITNTNSAPRSYNLALVVVNSSTAKFNLSLIDSYLNGWTGISNISLQGDLLTQLSAPEVLLFTDLTIGSRAGVVLPADNITGVEVSGKLPIGFIDVAGIEGLAFAVLTTATGVPVSVSTLLGSAANLQVLWKLLGSNAMINPATDAFVIPFNETNSVRLFAHDNTNPDLELVMTLTDQTSDNLPITAYVQIVPTTKNTVKPLVQSVMLMGNGGSINSLLSIANLTSTGPLGDVTVSAMAGATVNNAAGLGNVTAPSIFGSINVTNAGIYGVIQTTSGDFGRVILGLNGQITGVTSIYAKGAITGQIISRGDLVSSVKTSAFSGVIAVQGDAGAIQRNSTGNAVTSASGALIRFGGISISGADSGQIIVLGNIFGDLTVGGTMTGRVAVEGQAVAGLAVARRGILGNVTIHSFALGSAMISGGVIGDLTGNTTVSVSSAKGFLAARGGVNLKRGTSIAAGNLLQSVQSGSNLLAINALFTNGGSPLLFDTGGNLHGLALIETDLTHIQDNRGVLSGPIS